MTRNEANELAQTVSKEELQQMFANAQKSIKDWTQVSRVNKGLTKGAAYNILSVCIDAAMNKQHDALIATNMIREFGEYLPGFLKSLNSKSFYTPAHQEPDFIF